MGVCVMAHTAHTRPNGGRRGGRRHGAYSIYTAHRPEGALPLLPVLGAGILADERRVVHRVDGGPAPLHGDGGEGVVAHLVVLPVGDFGVLLEVARRAGEDARDLGHHLGCVDWWGKGGCSGVVVVGGGG